MARADLRHQITEVAGTVITVTHDPIEARLLGDRLVVVEGGRTTQAGSPAEIAAAPSSNWVADFLDVNIVSGEAAGTAVTTDRTTITIAEELSGPVHVTFPANAVTLHAEQPHGSARNVWEVTVEALVADDGRVQVRFTGPIDARAVVTQASAAQLGLAPGRPCWASVKATELQVLPA
jgi:molybdate transport system ATP-binding protein